MADHLWRAFGVDAEDGRWAAALLPSAAPRVNSGTTFYRCLEAE